MYLSVKLVEGGLGVALLNGDGSPLNVNLIVVNFQTGGSYDSFQCWTGEINIRENIAFYFGIRNTVSLASKFLNLVVNVFPL